MLLPAAWDRKTSTTWSGPGWSTPMPSRWPWPRPRSPPTPCFAAPGRRRTSPNGAGIRRPWHRQQGPPATTQKVLTATSRKGGTGRIRQAAGQALTTLAAEQARAAAQARLAGCAIIGRSLHGLPLTPARAHHRPTPRRLRRSCSSVTPPNWTPSTPADGLARPQRPHHTAGKPSTASPTMPGKVMRHGSDAPGTSPTNSHY